MNNKGDKDIDHLKKQENFQENFINNQTTKAY